MGIGDDKKEYAICPACNNPVRLFGLYKKMDKQPYGAHTGKTIEGSEPLLPKHNVENYEYCPLSRKGKRVGDKDARHSNPTDIQLAVYDILKNNFHKVVYVIERALKFKGSNAFWEKALKSFIESKAYLYPWITIANCPWMLCFFGVNNLALYKQGILINSSLYDCIEENCKNARFITINDEPELATLENNGSFLDTVSFRFSSHNSHLEDDQNLIETIQWCINFGSKDPKEIFNRKITVNQKSFKAILGHKWQGIDARWRHLCNMAEKLMPPLSQSVM